MTLTQDREKQTGKCQTDGLSVGTYSIGCVQVFRDLPWERQISDRAWSC